MKLQTYLAQKGLSPAEFARLVGHSEHGVKKWLRGERRPRPDALSKITAATDGRVRPNDFFEAAA